MTILRDHSKLNTAKSLRKDMTPHERKLWYLFLRDYPIKFYKQRIIHRYIVDFYCASAKIVIEIDGSQHYEEEGRRQDIKRSRVLESCGLKVLRYSNREIDREFSSVCEDIDRIVKERRSLFYPTEKPSP